MEVQPLPITVRRLWRVVAIGQAGAVLVILATIDVVAHRRTEIAWPPVVGPVVIAAIIMAIGLLVADIRYRSWRFELTGDWIQARWGVISRHSATVPRNRVQTLTSENGPVDRLLGLTSVTVHTAGAGAPNLSIPHLDDSTVEWLREELARGAID